MKESYTHRRTETCPFCDRMGTRRNFQGLVVCEKHVGQKLPEMQCVCGDIVDMRKGAGGVFFRCINCGNVPLKKLLEINDVKEKPKKEGE